MGAGDANAAYRFANELIFSEFAHVAELRTSKASVSSLLGQLSVPFTFIDYFLKGVTRVLVDYHLLEDAFSFEDGDKIVKISLAASRSLLPPMAHGVHEHRGGPGIVMSSSKYSAGVS